MEEFSDKAGFRKNLSVGWAIFWRLWLLMLAVEISLRLSLKSWGVRWIGIVVFVGIPLANWAGKSVAVKRYYVAIPSFIGWSIWWRGVVCSWIFFPAGLITGIVVSSGSPNWLPFLLLFLCVYPGFFVAYLLVLGSTTNHFIIDRISQQQKREKVKATQVETEAEKEAPTLADRLMGRVSEESRKKKE